MYSKHLLYIIFILIIVNDYATRGENSTNTSILATTTTTTSTLSTLVTCPEGSKQVSSSSKCQLNTERQDNTTAMVKNQATTSGGSARRSFFLFIGCALTILVIITLIITYNRITEQHNRHLSPNPTINPTIGNRFHNVLQSISFSNFRKNGRFNFFSVSNNNYSSGINRQGETSRTHLNENQDEALLFDDPYADGGISSGIHGSSANPYKSLTLSVA
ncbi:unnamed protein product [Rotaria magnacalcarata]|uniref:Uncharacterized protein n=1 Tax=Rotaria magnacalcarata TaxID=392030 RepID=A0A815HHS0_9BILA|nr:unnamed protein product [Rotaria magnacalcarata]CAF1644039.1 unnamed protein product [Rotaria magnacalcarata]CAF2043773.1 unnamed protein product [Rotaria magnacalcarata]CAF2135151.1 unnamed protein product [Rotaria magnacalcarata]CAF3786317.1 unnamed protein product [Rotaria magnacalcarata]